MAITTPSKFYCTPAIVYLVFSAVAVILAIGTVSTASILIKVIFILIWAWFLNYLCDSGYTTVSWFLVVFPFIFMLLMIGIAMEATVLAKTNPSLVTTLTGR
jgi:hypothetical protein